MLEGEKMWASEEKELVITICPMFFLHISLSQVITRASLAAKKIITIMVFTLIGCALCFMGLEIDLAVVWTCIKVP